MQQLICGHQKLPYIGVSVHILCNNFEFTNYTICIESLPDSHSGDNIHEVLIK